MAQRVMYPAEPHIAADLERPRDGRFELVELYDFMRNLSRLILRWRITEMGHAEIAASVC